MNKITTGVAAILLALSTLSVASTADAAAPRPPHRVDTGWGCGGAC